MTGESKKRNELSVALKDLNTNIPVEDRGTAPGLGAALQSLNQEVISWLKGDIQDPPAMMNKLKDDVLERITWFIVLTVIENLQIVNRELEYVRRADERLFAESTLDEFGDGRLATRRKQALKSSMELLEYARKFLKQNKEVIEGAASPKSELHALMSSMTPEQLEVAVTIIKRVAESEKLLEQIDREEAIEDGDDE